MIFLSRWLWSVVTGPGSRHVIRQIGGLVLDHWTTVTASPDMMMNTILMSARHH